MPGKAVPVAWMSTSAIALPSAALVTVPAISPVCCAIAEPLKARAKSARKIRLLAVNQVLA